jgi:hypothetical protein
MARSVRFALLAGLGVLAPLVAGAEPTIRVPAPPPEPLWQAELRLGYGIAMGGNGARMSKRPTPLTVSADVLFAFNEDPSLWGYGGLLVETLDRNSVGSVFGVQLKPHDSRWHFSGGGAWIVAPYMLIGATASAGACKRMTRLVNLCGDAQLTAYFAGGDLADGRTVTQAQLVLGAMIDAL